MEKQILHRKVADYSVIRTNLHDFTQYQSIYDAGFPSTKACA